MTTDMFLEKVKALGFDAEISPYSPRTIIVYHKNDAVCNVFTDVLFSADFAFVTFDTLLTLKQKRALFDLVCEYVRTPIDERGRIQ